MRSLWFLRTPLGLTGQSRGALSRTWVLGPPTTRSPPTHWWTPWGATLIPASGGRLCPRWGGKTQSHVALVLSQRVTFHCCPTGDALRFPARPQPRLPAHGGGCDAHSSQQWTRERQRVSETFLKKMPNCFLLDGLSGSFTSSLPLHPFCFCYKVARKRHMACLLMIPLVFCIEAIFSILYWILHRKYWADLLLHTKSNWVRDGHQWL